VSSLLPAVERVAVWVARRRHARALHPRGTVHPATWTVTDPDSALGRTLGTGSRPVVVRLSRGLGLPRPLPDVHGVAVRLEADGDRVDLLLSGVRGFVSTLLPYRSPRGLVLLGLFGPDDGVYRIAEHTLAGRGRGKRTVGRLVLGEARGDEAAAYDPYLHHHPRLEPVGFLSGVREAAYRGSRRGRRR